MKRVSFLFLLAILPLMASAYDAQIDGIYYNLNTETKRAKVTYGNTNFTVNGTDIQEVINIIVEGE